MDDDVIIRIPRAKLKAGGRKRWQGVSKLEHKQISSAAVKSFWANLTPEERSVEMKRRAKVRERNRARKKK